MTPALQLQREYIITEDHLKMIEKRGFQWMARLIRSRPAPAATVDCSKCDEWDAAVDEMVRTIKYHTNKLAIISVVEKAAAEVRQRTASINDVAYYSPASAQNIGTNCSTELNSYTGAYVMQIVDGRIVVIGRTKYKNFKALFPLHEVKDFIKRSKSGVP